MRKTLFIVLFVLIAGAATALAQCRDVRIARGRISTVVSGVTAKKGPCYRIRAKRGQTITIHLAAANRGVHFFMTEDYYDAGFTAENVRDWEGQLGNVNAYIVGVEGPRPALPFKLEVTIR